MTENTAPVADLAQCPGCGYPGLVLTDTRAGDALACVLPDCSYIHSLAPEPEPEDHTPCCSAHGVDMTCARYRRTHFVERRPCCATDAARLRKEQDTPELP